MELTPQQYERILQFIDGDMTISEMDAFKEELAAFPEMRKQLDFELAVSDHFAQTKTSEPISPELVTTKVTTTNIPVKIISRKSWVLYASAACLLAVIITLLLYTNTKPPAGYIADRNDSSGIKKNDSIPVRNFNPENETKTNEQQAGLFKEYFTVDTLPENYPLFLADAFTDYEEGRFKKMQHLNLSAIPEIRGTDAVNNKENILQLAHYYKGIAYLESGNTKEAMINLKWVERNARGIDLKTKAQWYLALAYIKNADKKPAKVLLEKIMAVKGYTYKPEQIKKLIRVIGE